MNNSGQTGLKINDNIFATSDLFRGLLRVDGDNLALLNPYVPGKGFFIWTKLPRFMELYDSELTEQFKNITEKMFMGFDGIADWSTQGEEVGNGTSGKKMTMVTGVNDDFNNFSIKVPMELSGSPIRTFLDLWLSGISDPKTGVATYLGEMENIEGGYNPANHSGEALYMTTDPSETVLGMEFACLICAIMPDKSTRGHLNTSVGDSAVPQLDLSFTGVKYESPAINEIAKDALSKLTYVKNYLDFNPDA